MKVNFPDATDGRVARTGVVGEYGEVAIIAVDGRVARGGSVEKFHIAHRVVNDVRAARSGAIAKDHAAKTFSMSALAALELFKNCMEP